MTNRLAEIKSGHLVGDDDVDWLIARVERLEAVAIVCDVARHLGVAEGKEAAAKIAEGLPFGTLLPPSGHRAAIAAAIRAEIKS